jgi:hypothetical protein
MIDSIVTATLLRSEKLHLTRLYACRICGHVPAGFLPGQQLADLLTHGLQVRRVGLRTTCAKGDTPNPAVVSV